MKNRKGFTLIELIAVIVILEVIVLIATTSIGPLITRARKGALGEEGLHMIEAAKYAHKLDEIDEANNIKGSKSICYSLKWLNENDYYDKGEKEGYTGSVLIEYDEETKNYSYKFWLSNGTYVFNNVNEKDYDSELATEGKEAIEDCEGLSKKLPSYTYPEPDPELCPNGIGDIIKHDGTIDVDGDGTPDDAGDNGYRYSGCNPNNFICFGPGSESYNNGTSTTCPDGNLYRIIGYVPVELPDGTKENRIKVIKSEYATHDDLGKDKADGTYQFHVFYKKLKRVKAETSIEGFHWNDRAYNTWSRSSLYKALNDSSSGYLYNINDWANKIENVKWNVDGYDKNPDLTPKQMYDVENNKNQGASVQVNAKIGLMYPSDYSFASIKDNWTSTLHNYDNHSNSQNNWLFNGVWEWTISRNSNYINDVFNVYDHGFVSGGLVNYAYGVRPVFYLKSNVTLSGDGDIDGSDFKPYKVK